MAALTIQDVTVAGITPSYTAAAAGGDTVAPGTDTRPLNLHVKNGGGSSITVTVTDPTSQNPGAATSFNPNAAITVTNAQERMIRLDPSRFRDTSTGNIAIGYSAVASVTVGVFRTA